MHFGCYDECLVMSCTSSGFNLQSLINDYNLLSKEKRISRINDGCGFYIN